MTREELVVNRLNQLEQRIKAAVLRGDKTAVDLAIKEQNGYVDAITDLGYRPIQDDDKAENVELDSVTYWIYKYTGIEDRTGR